MTQDVIRMTDFACWEKRNESTPRKYANAIFDFSLIENKRIREQIRAYFSWYCSRKDISIRTVYDLSSRYRKLALFLNECCSHEDALFWEKEKELTRDMEKWLLKRGEATAVIRHVNATDRDSRIKHELLMLLHRICAYLSDTSGVPETKKDIWRLDRLQIPLRQNPARPVRHLSFTGIRQSVFKKECKTLIYEELRIKSISCCEHQIAALGRLSRFLDKKKKKEDSFHDFTRDLIEEYLVYLKTEDDSLSDYRREISTLRSLFEDAAYFLEDETIGSLFLPTDTPRGRKLLYRAFSDAELSRINKALLTMDEQVARAVFVQEFLGLRLSDTLLLKQDCLKKRNGRWTVTIDQQKTGRGYTKSIIKEDAQLIQAAIRYTRERFGERAYVFVREDDPDLPMTCSRIKYHLQKAFRENHVCTDDGVPLGCRTHLFRHTYGRKLADLHVEDHVIAQLLGHSGTTSVHHYRRMSDLQMAKEIKPVLDDIDEMIRRSRIKWK